MGGMLRMSAQKSFAAGAPEGDMMMMDAMPVAMAMRSDGAEGGADAPLMRKMSASAADVAEESSGSASMANDDGSEKDGGGSGKQHVATR
jgi:hypothetical protein